MRKENLSKIIIVFTIIFIIIIIAIGILIFSLTRDNEKDRKEMTELEYEEMFTEEGDNIYEKNKNENVKREQYAGIRNSIQRYLDAINFSNPSYYGYNENNEFTLIYNEKEISDIVYDMLDTQYVKKNNINSENLFNNINKLNDLYLLSIAKISKIYENNNIKSFAVHIIVQNQEDYSLLQENFLIVNIDDNNLSFSIEPLSGIKSIDDINITTDKITEIKLNENNVFQYVSMTDQDMVLEYISLYKRISLIAPGYVYNNFLDEEYKNAKFGSVQEFTNYVQDNKQKISSISIKKYQVDVYGNEYTRYVALDQNNHYYIIKENQTMDFKMQLDTYTIDVPEFIEKYNSASDDKKASMNISKIVDAINDKDYKYVYNKLNETYKNSNFADINKFKEFLNNKFYDESVIKESTAKKDGDVYICNLKISDKEGTSKLVDVTILVRLSQGTNYEISFSM